MSDSSAFDTSQTFETLGLREEVVKGCTESGFTHPTDIQSALIPAAITGKDLFGQARTGTGKTAAFGLPLLHQMTDTETSMQALILVPTRELAAQVASELESLGKHTGLQAVCIIGGESMSHQMRALKRGGHIIVGTPGRVMDLYDRRQIHFDNLKFAVLDEVDRMLDIGFRDDIRKILGNVKTDHQTIFVSATMDDNIEKLGRRFMKSDAEKIITTGDVLTVSLVEQQYLTVERWDKRSLLLHLLRHEKPDTTVVFCKTKATVHKLTKYMRDKNVDAKEIHGDMHQGKRKRVMETMREGKLSLLIASDLAARGLDIEHISHVINYDLPEDPEIYIHRIGRTARAGRKGHAWSFVCPEEGDLLTKIEKLAGVMIEKMEYPDFKPGPVPKDIADERKRGERPKEEKPKSRALTPAEPNELEELSKEELEKMFPGGVIPKSAPKQTLGSRFARKRRR